MRLGVERVVLAVLVGGLAGCLGAVGESANDAGRLPPGGDGGGEVDAGSSMGSDSGVACPQIFGPAELPNAAIERFYEFQFQADCGRAPYSWTIDGGLPAGLALSWSGQLTGVPTALPTPNPAELVVTVTDADGQSQTGAFLLGVMDGGGVLTIDMVDGG